MVDHRDISKEDLAANFADEVRAIEELYRCERVFILQPQRIVLDEQYRRLVSLLPGSRQHRERTRIDDLLNEQLHLILEFKAGLDEAEQTNDYSNYGPNF